MKNLFVLGMKNLVAIGIRDLLNPFKLKTINSSESIVLIKRVQIVLLIKVYYVSSRSYYHQYHLESKIFGTWPPGVVPGTNNNVIVR